MNKIDEKDTCDNCKQLTEKDNINYFSEYDTKFCNDCCISCNDCGKAVDKDDILSEDGDYYCEYCYGERFASCEECNETIPRDDAIYSENFSQTLCEYCYKEKLLKCFECGEELIENNSYEFSDEKYCQKCYENIAKKEFPELTSGFQDFNYTKKDKYLKQLMKLLPIDVKDLKSKHQSLAGGLGDLFKFCQGKKITIEIVKKYRESLEPETFPVEYTAWAGVQRSRDKSTFISHQPQLVINILASEKINKELNSNFALKDLFNKINDLSRKSTHPVVDNQIGWVRVDMAPDMSYLLIDEIQSDHQNAVSALRLNSGTDIKEIRTALKNRYNLDDHSLNLLLDQYNLILKDFPNIAIEAASNFAKSKNISKIFYHTYEGGKALKENNPPKSLYTKLPLEHFFLQSLEKPFDLQQDFLEREANIIYKLFKEARMLCLSAKSKI